MIHIVLLFVAYICAAHAFQSTIHHRKIHNNNGLFRGGVLQYNRGFGVKTNGKVASDNGLTRLFSSTDEDGIVRKDQAGVFSVSVEIGGKNISFETGKLGRQANGAAVARVGDTMIYATACYNPTPESVDFTPLKVDYFSRYRLVGRGDCVLFEFLDRGMITLSHSFLLVRQGKQLVPTSKEIVEEMILKF